MSTHTPSAPSGGNSTADDRGLQRRGRDLLFALAAAIRALQLYPLENQAVVNALAELDSSARAVIDQEGELSIHFVGDVFFVNDLRLRIDLASYATFGQVGRALQRHGVGRVDVSAGVETAEWTAFLSILMTEPDEEDRFATFADRLARSSVPHLEVQPDREREPQPDESSRQMAKRAYAQTVAVARETMSALRMGRGVSIRPVKRAVQSIVDQVLTNETSIFGLTSLRDYDEYTFTHSVNVCIFSVALGKKLGFDKHQLYELGLGALMHDVGKVKMPWEVINKAGPLTEEEFGLMKEHPTEGLLTLFAMRGLAELPLRAMLVAYEHHMKIDQTGYPRSVRPRTPSLFGKIVAVADGFDAATTKRSYQAQPWPAEQVLREMRDNNSRGFDPLIVKAFISMTGIYPVGSLVILDSYELAVVVAPSTRPDAMHQPVVKIIHDAMGIPHDVPPVLDLTHLDPATGTPVRTIIKTTDPERYGIHVGDYFV